MNVVKSLNLSKVMFTNDYQEIHEQLLATSFPINLFTGHDTPCGKSAVAMWQNDHFKSNSRLSIASKTSVAHKASLIGHKLNYLLNFI